MAREIRLTQAGYDRLKNDLQQERARLEEATGILHELAGVSDDYDDSGLEDAKRQKARLEQRIDDLEDQLARATIITQHQAEHVDLGSVVSLQEKGAGETLEVQLVSPIEASVLDGQIPRISDESPLGKALMGRRHGEAFTVTLGNKVKEYVVESIN